ncbi:AAA family ATPase [Candidatus Poribacteria bacterium]|nr:AAA family ATPase [Candidatus Poribacteria bacterium]
MATLEGFRVRNFGVLKDVTLGRLWDKRKTDALTPMTTIIGKNGVGKSALFDAFGFLSDALSYNNVEDACNARGRGGFGKIRTQGTTEPIEFIVFYREHGNTRPISYQIAIDTDEYGHPYVLRERLRQRRKGQTRGQPFSFLIPNNGCGIAWKGEQDGFQIVDDTEDIQQFNILFEDSESGAREEIEMDDPRNLGINSLGVLKTHPRISAFRRFIEGWYLSYFTPDAARSLPLAGPQKQLNTSGDNLGNVVQFMKREHQQRFETILTKIADKIPGISQIDTEETNDGRLLLKFNDKGFKDPFYAQQMSDGTLKLFTYLLMLEHPSPPPFLCIEEPENGLYHKLLEILATEFREHATGLKDGSQIFITTHQPYFVDALDPKEVWILEKGEDGFSTIRRASEDPLVNNLVEEGLPLGGLWYSDYLDPR